MRSARSISDPDLNRETFIALRAMRTAHRVASDVIHKQREIDVTTVFCRNCGSQLTTRDDTGCISPRCRGCGEWNVLPGHLYTPRGGREPEETPQAFPLPEQPFRDRRGVHVFVRTCALVILMILLAMLLVGGSTIL